MITINFNCGGGFFSYYLGIAQYMYEHYILDDCIFYGCSAGVFSAAVLCFKLNPKQMFFNTSIPHLKETYKCFPKVFLHWKQNIFPFLNENFNNFINEKQFQENKKRLFINVFDIKKFKSYYINDYNDRNELCNYMIASTTIPFLLTTYKNCYENINGRILIDGGFGRNSKECDININPTTFGRGKKFFDYWPSVGFGKNIEMFHIGYNDAKENPEFFNILKLKSKL